MYRAAAGVTSAAAAAAAEEAERRARSALSQSEKVAERLTRAGQEEAERARRRAGEELARVKEEADMAAEEERSRALKEVWHSGVSLFSLCVYRSVCVSRVFDVLFCVGNVRCVTLPLASGSGDFDRVGRVES